MILANTPLQHNEGPPSGRYPRVTRTSVPTPVVSTTERVQERDDTMMRINEYANEDVEMAEPPQGGYCYLVLDTNVLIYKLSVIERFCEDIDKLGIAVLVVVPSVVVSELDGLKKRPDDVGWFAHTASSFLLKRVRMRKSLKVQARAEICHTKIDDPARKNDLLIFDCCLYFKAKGQLVLLSSDKNLSIECEKEDIPTIQPPKQLWTSRELAKTLFSDVDFSRFRGLEPVYRPSHTSGMLGVTETPPSYDEDSMDIDDASTTAEVLVPSHALDALHLQFIDHYTILLRYLTEQVRKEYKDDVPPTTSSHAPEYRRRAFKDWSLKLCLEYLGTKTPLIKTSPELWKFMLKRSEDYGWRRGQDWSRQDWVIAQDALSDIGEKFRSGAILGSLEGVRVHVNGIFKMPLRPTGI